MPIICTYIIRARGDAQKGAKLRIQKCYSTWRCAKRAEIAHLEMLQHVEMRKKGRNCASRNAAARGDAQKGPKLRIQKCYSTWRCAKRSNIAHPAVLGQRQETRLKHDEWGQKAESVQKKGPGVTILSDLQKTAATYSPTWWGSTIGDGELNFSVRNGKRWFLTAITAAYIT